MIQLSETEKNNVVWPENSPYKSYKRGKLPFILPHFNSSINFLFVVNKMTTKYKFYFLIVTV